MNASPLPPILVIDTQTVMDWMVFADPSTVALAQAVENRRVRWIGCAVMLDELMHVLGRGVAAAWSPDIDRIAARYRRLCEMVEAPIPSGPRLVCRDRDDQVFIDLAVQHQARWLISRDKALLALRKRAQMLHGVAILRLGDWQSGAPD